MVPDGGDLYQVDPGAAKLDQGILLHYLDGFIDAGAAGRLLTAHLLGSLDHKAVVTFDVDRLIDYRSRRPPMTYDKDHWESYDEPELAIHQVRDSAGKTFLMLTGRARDHARAGRRIPADRGPAAGAGQRCLAAGAAPGRGEPGRGRLRRARAPLPGAGRLPRGGRRAAGVRGQDHRPGPARRGA